jgi:tripartite-type tricarboxylate transporter receptor subunit TctC
MGSMTVNMSLFPKLTFDPAKDLTPVVLIEKASLVRVTRSDKPYKCVKVVVAATKSNPGALKAGNAGSGGAYHLSAELFEGAAGIQVMHIPYKGAVRPARPCCPGKPT